MIRNMATSKSMVVLLSFLTLSTLSTSSPSIQISPTILSNSGDSVVVRWSSIPSPSPIDFLAVYSPPSSPDPLFIGYVFLNSSPTWPTGAGTLRLPLSPLSSNYSFRIFRWTPADVGLSPLDDDRNPIPSTDRPLAASGELTFAPAGPRQIHLSFTDDEGEMRVLFVAPDGEGRFVAYGEDAGRLDRTVPAMATRYGIKDMCGPPANESRGWRDPGWVHDGVMKGLNQGTRYFYKVGSDTGRWSQVHSFISRNRDSGETIAFIFGDMGTSVPYSTYARTQEESISTVKWILRDIESLGNKPAFVSHIGDISYARGYSWLWDAFFTQIEPIASKLPYHVCIGNHEYDWPSQPWKPDWAARVYGTDGGGECGVPYSVRFKMPGNSSLLTGTGAPNTQNLYYSFNVGVVHFVYMSTETDFLPGSDQYNFLKHDLENIDRGKVPFVVFQGHRPMYTTSNEPRDAPLREKMLEHLEPLLVKNKVDLVLWGHVHRYERFCPMKNFTCGEGLPVHVVVGMGGQDWQPIWEPRPNHPTDPVYPQPGRSMFRGGEFGYTRLVATRKKLTLIYVGNHDGEVHDVLEIPSSPYHDIHDSRGGAIVESAVSIYVKLGSVLVLGAFIGYVVGFVSRSRRDRVAKRNWTPLKTEDS